MVVQLDKGKGEKAWKDNMQKKIQEWEQMMNNIGVGNQDESQEEESAEPMPRKGLLKKKSEIVNPDRFESMNKS